MMPLISPENLLSWAAQAFVIAAAGALLPMVFRIQHPRSHLLYCHLVLIACFVLPVIQPWQYPVVTIPVEALPNSPIITEAATTSSESVVPSISSPQIVLWTFIAGLILRALWLAAGLIQIYRYRATATPMYPLPQSIVKALAATKTEARFAFSSRVPGPVTFGVLPAVILLPESFTSLGHDEQYGIACHELLHVKRRDWLSTMTEEVISVVFWFNPGIWWLLAQTRLSREELVDAEVVRLTSAPEPYIEALLAMAARGARLDLAPAPLFLRRRHLTQRMHSLLSEVSMSRFRLASSYASMVALLAAAGWAVLAAFPLMGETQFQVAEPVRMISQKEGGVATVNPGGNVMRRTQVGYPPEALQKRVEGSVFAELSVNKAGEVTDARILSGPTELRRSVLQSVLQWRYAPDSVPTGTVVINVDFRIQPATDGAAPESTTVRGARGGFTAGAPAPPPPPPPPPPNLNATVAGIDVTNVGEQYRAQVETRLRGFVGQTLGTALKQVAQALNESLPPEAGGRTWGFRRAENGDAVITVSTNANGLVVRTPFGDVPAGRGGAQTPFGVVGGQVGEPGQIPVNPQTGASRIRVGSGVMASKLIAQVKPFYPDEAKQAKIQGVVVLEAVISTTGQVTELRTITGHPLLAGPAMDAVKQWLYSPVMLNDQAVEAITTVTLNFAVQE